MSAGVCACTFQSRNVSGWDSEGLSVTRPVVVKRWEIT